MEIELSEIDCIECVWKVQSDYFYDNYIKYKKSFRYYRR